MMVDCDYILMFRTGLCSTVNVPVPFIVPLRGVYVVEVY